MNKEIKIKTPIFTGEELTEIDKLIANSCDNIVEEVSKQIYKDRECIVLQKIIEKQQEELNKEKQKNKELELCLKAEEKYSEGLNRDIKSLLNIEPNTNFISKDKIREKIEKTQKDCFLYENGLKCKECLEICIVEGLQNLLEEE